MVVCGGRRRGGGGVVFYGTLQVSHPRIMVWQRLKNDWQSAISGLSVR